VRLRGYFNYQRLSQPHALHDCLAFGKVIPLKVGKTGMGVVLSEAEADVNLVSKGGK
jgi:hypothetical protein